MVFLPRHVLVWCLALLGVAAIGWLDYASGAELRVYPLYFAPISYVAWHRGRFGALIIAAYSAVCWLVSNYLAGMAFTHPALWVANTVVHGASFATIALLIAVLRDALQRERAVSRTDALTTLLNTRAFHDEGARALAVARRTGRPVTLAYLDLDDFKRVNDVRGHKAGDEVLRNVARAMAAAIRPSDLLARVGGDEFVLLLPETNQPQAAVVLERLRKAVTGTLAGSAAGITCSIGAVTFHRLPASVDAMMQCADARMYEAKASGKNRTSLASID